MENKRITVMTRNSKRDVLKALFDAGEPTRPEDVVGGWIWRISLAYQRRAEIALKQFGLTHLQFVVLINCAWLNLTNDAVSQRDLVNEIGMQEAQLSFMIKSLKSKKLVTQRAHSEDSRIRLIEVTPAGLTMLLDSLPTMRGLQAQLWPSAVQNEHFIATIREALERWEE